MADIKARQSRETVIRRIATGKNDMKCAHPFFCEAAAMLGVRRGNESNSNSRRAGAVRASPWSRKHLESPACLAKQQARSHGVSEDRIEQAKRCLK